MVVDALVDLDLRATGSSPSVVGLGLHDPDQDAMDRRTRPSIHQQRHDGDDRQRDAVGAQPTR